MSNKRSSGSSRVRLTGNNAPAVGRRRSNRAGLPAKPANYIARRILMASVLYYGLAKPVVSDDEFDRWCKEAASRWDELDPHLRWQLGSPEEIRTSAYHVKITQATAGGAWAWLKSTGVTERFMVAYTRPPKRSKKRNIDWWTPDAFTYHVLENQARAKPKRVRLEAEGNAPGTAKRKRSKRTTRVRGFFSD